MSKKVCIVGCNANNVEAPFSEKGWEFWGINCLYLYLNSSPFTRWFEIHKFSVTLGGTWLRKGKREYMGTSVNLYLSGLNSLEIPVYMQHKIPLIWKSIAFPKAEITNKFGNYFTSSAAWMMALAIHEGFDTIGLYGLNMDHESEYHFQKPCLEYYIGLAKGLGIEILTPENCGLLHSDHLYGFDEIIKSFN
jgi:hypothetical protein